MPRKASPPKRSNAQRPLRRSFLPAIAAKRLLEIASSIEAEDEGRICVERVNIVFVREGGSPDECRAGIDRLKADGLIEMDVSGAFFRLTGKGALGLATRQRILDSFRRRNAQQRARPDRPVSRSTTVPAIKHLSGPQKGIWNLSDPGDTRILIGRAPGCDVDFPPDYLIVAERHLVLSLQPTGEWKFEAIGDHYVSINGRPATHGQTINFGDQFVIGEPGGPSFEFGPAEWAFEDDETIED